MFIHVHNRSKLEYSVKCNQKVTLAKPQNVTGFFFQIILSIKMIWDSLPETIGFLVPFVTLFVVIFDNTICTMDNMNTSWSVFIFSSH